MNQIVANMAGNIWRILVQENDQVDEGQELVILESMKMEIPIEADVSCKIVEIHKKEGDFVNEGEVLLTIE